MLHQNSIRSELILQELHYIKFGYISKIPLYDYNFIMLEFHYTVMELITLLGVTEFYYVTGNAF